MSVDLNENKQKRLTYHERIDRLEEFCRNNSMLWFVSKSNKKLDSYLSQIETEEERQELLEKLEIAKQDYLYICVRKSVGKKQGREIISLEDCERLREAGTLGVFGYPRKIEELAEKYKSTGEKNSSKVEKRKKEIQEYLYEQNLIFGGLDNFKEKYIECLLKGENFDIPRSMKSLFIKSFDVASFNFINTPYSDFMEEVVKIAKKKEPILIFDSRNIDKEISRLTQREERVMQLLNGLDGRGKKTEREVGNEVGITGAAVSEIIKRAYKKLIHRFKPVNITKAYYNQETTEKFIRAYFEKKDIFIGDDEKLDEQIKKELFDILGLEILEKDIKNIYGHTRLDKDDYRKIFDEINHHKFYLSYAVIPEELREEMISEYWNKNINSENQNFVEKVTFYDVIKNKVYYEKESDYDRIYELAEVDIENINFSDSKMKKLKEEGINTLGDIIFNYSQGSIIIDDELKEGINSFGIHMSLEKPEDKNMTKKWKIRRDDTKIAELGISKESCDKLRKEDIDTIGKLLKSEIQDEKVYEELKNIINKLDWEIDFDKLQENIKKEMNSPLRQMEKIPMYDLDLSVRTWNSLARAEICTVGDFVKKNKEELEKIRNLGKKSFKEVLQKIYQLGFYYDEENDCFSFKGEQVQNVKEIEDAEDEEKQEQETKIEDLGLSVRSYNCLSRAGIYTIEDLTQYSAEQIKLIRNLGPRSFDEVIEKLSLIGYKYDEDNGWIKSEPKDIEKIDDKEQIDTMLENRIEQIKEGYEELEERKKKITELQLQLQKVLQELNSSSKKVEVLTEMIGNNSELLIEMGVLEKFKSELENEKMKLVQKQKEKQEIEELKRELEDMEL